MENNYREVIKDLSGAYGITRLIFDSRLEELKNQPPEGVDMNVVESVVVAYLHENHSSSDTRLFGEFPPEMIDELSRKCLESL